MPTLGSFQSVLQLAAGLNLGVSGILTLWENPIEREREVISRLWNRTKDLNRHYPSATDAQKTKISDLLRDCRGQIKAMIDNKSSTTRFTAEKTISLIGAAVALVSLLYASEYPELLLTNSIRWLSYITLLVTPLIIMFLAFRVWRMSGKLRETRAELDKRYVALVNELAGS